MKQIAVIEDNPDNRLLVRVILQPLYEVTDYENGRAALDGLRQQKPDLVLLDVSLPEMDGTEVLRRIRAEDCLRDLPVIALTAHAMTGDRDKFLAAGFDDYLTKPIVDETLLLDAIQQLLARKPGSCPAKTDTAPQNLDVGAVERLQRLGDNEFACKMIDLFLDYSAKRITEARAAQAAGNLAGVARAMHPLKSSAGNVGADQVQALATRIEELAEQGQGEQAAASLTELEQAFAVVKPRLEETKRGLAPPPK
ncbi:MAG TPA: response regulator [Candidatus Paceibacterota bacterium]|nr:response regulator [Verrucomicrobiota bacterium]HSA11616.1 response regulator [Candidatus Paceibacterota bacterium]